ncbi:MAG: pyruvate dehydrogenase complex dihydrolipoamide acetyltransferase [Bacteroidetes bacterium]|jgi:pyruvate dehydrogenase E2 component (dihydrolipoamide acetyltransferase)|nr:pyruvate dehydrogenase complex dihydrolipoamide acetyltransferase [Bacteroidota bacterium]
MRYKYTLKKDNRKIMADIIEMPLLSDTMEEGVIAAWHVKEGDTVASGDLLAEVETDKATMEVESYYDGTVLHIGAKVGEGIPVGKLMIIIGKKDEDVSGILAEYNARTKGGKPTEPASSPAAAATPAVASATAVATPPAKVDGADSRLKASPLAKAMAKETGLDLARLQGSGDGGRIVKKDVEAAMQAGGTPAAGHAATPTHLVPAPDAQYEDVALSQMRKTIARRLSESKFSAPHFYLTMPIDMERAAAFREQLKQEDTKISFNDLVVKACATALRKHPKVNSSWLGDRIRYNHDIHIGVAVAVEEGLIVPVIRHTDRKGLGDINSEVKLLADRARNKQLQPDEFQGNTFTISNLGMYGIEEFTAIINPPDACILAVGAIQEVPVVKNGLVVPGKQMRVTLSCDHRAVDGATGSEFLQTLKFLLENPVRMLL